MSTNYELLLDALQQGNEELAIEITKIPEIRSLLSGPVEASEELFGLKLHTISRKLVYGVVKRGDSEQIKRLISISRVKKALQTQISNYFADLLRLAIDSGKIEIFDSLLGIIDLDDWDHRSKDMEACFKLACDYKSQSPLFWEHLMQLPIAAKIQDYITLKDKMKQLIAMIARDKTQGPTKPKESKENSENKDTSETFILQIKTLLAKPQVQTLLGENFEILELAVDLENMDILKQLLSIKEILEGSWGDFISSIEIAFDKGNVQVFKCLLNVPNIQAFMEDDACNRDMQFLSMACMGKNSVAILHCLLSKMTCISNALSGGPKNSSAISSLLQELTRKDITYLPVFSRILQEPNVLKAWTTAPLAATILKNIHQPHFMIRMLAAFEEARQPLPSGITYQDMSLEKFYETQTIQRHKEIEKSFIPSKNAIATMESRVLSIIASFLEVDWLGKGNSISPEAPKILTGQSEKIQQLERRRLQLEMQIKKLREEMTNVSHETTTVSNLSRESSSCSSSSKNPIPSLASLPALPVDLQRMVCSDLNTPDLAHVRESGRVFHDIYTPEMSERRRVSTELLPHVFNAAPDKVAAFFARTDAQAKMVLTKTCYREGYLSKKLKQFVCFRRWRHVSALQAAALSLDNFLVLDLLSHIQNDAMLRKQAAQQLQEILNRKNVTLAAESADLDIYQAPFKALCRAYKNFLIQRDKALEIYEKRCGEQERIPPEERLALDKLWQEVGECQKRLPIYGLQEFCTGGSFDPTPAFVTPPSRRQELRWFDADNLGVTNRCLYKCNSDLAIMSGWSIAPQEIDLDSDAFNHLCEVRQLELQHIVSCLLTPGMPITLRSDKPVTAVKPS